MTHLPSGSTFAILASLGLAACGGTVTGNTGATGGTGTTSATAGTGGTGGSGATGGTGTTTGTAGTGGSGDPCVDAGGKCVPLTPSSCPNGMFGDVDKFPCGGGAGGSGTGCCFPLPPVPCTDVGGTCVATVPDACQIGELADSTQYTCGPGIGTSCCLPPVCTPGMDQTCNDMLSMSSYAGHCDEHSVCVCDAGFKKKASGKCGL